MNRVDAPSTWPDARPLSRLRWDCHWSLRQPAGAAGVVMDRDPAHAARHRLGGDAGHQGDPEAAGDEPEPGGPVAGCEGDCWFGDAGPCAELGGAAGTGPDDPALVCELVGLDLFPGGEGV
jgi:hypothetical protein